MGERLGWAIFLLFLLTIDGHFTQSQELRNSTCQSDCLTQDYDASSCTSSPDPDCRSVEPPFSGEVTKAKGPLVRVTGITVTPRPYSTQYIVTLRWTSPDNDDQNSTRGLRVQWQALVPSGSCSASNTSNAQVMPVTTNITHCQILNFLHSPNSSSIPLTTRWCYTTNHSSRCHSVTFSSPQRNSSVTLTIVLPSNLTIIEYPSTGAEWVTPVGVSVDRERRSVLTIIQGAPPDLNITSYQLTLVYEKDGRTIQEQGLSQNETSHLFENVTEEGIYVVRVGPLGPGCVPRCQLSESAHIYLPGLTPGPPPTPATRSTSPVATASAPTPSPTSPTTTSNDMGLHKTTTATDPSVIVKPAVDQTEYNKSRNIILGTVFGVVFLALIATIIFCIYRRTRSVNTVGFQMRPFRQRGGSNSSIMMEDTLKNQPIVLVLYSYDCPAHEVAVTTFAYYLKEVANCEVILDIWDQHNIQEQGVYAWLVDKVDVAQFILMICSTGARFKCARNRQFRMKHDRTLQDVFAWGVDHVAEKIRTATNVSEAKARYISAYFDYAGKSDIPPKLEITKKFCLMKDLYSLYCHFHGIKPGQGHSGSNSKHGFTVDTYSKTEEGRQLQDALIDAKHFFKDNPNWLGQTLEAVTPVLSANRDISTESTPEESSRKKRMGPVSPSMRSEKDPILEERKKKRDRDVVGTLERIPLSKKEELSTPGTSPSHVPSEGSGSVTSMSPLVSPTVSVKPRSAGTAFTASSGTLQSRELDLEEETDADDTSQMQRDIDFIQNFDVHHTWDVPKNGGSTGHFFVDVDMGVYTPPEDFISMASLEEEANRALAQSDPSSPRHGNSSTASGTPPPSGKGVSTGSRSGSEPSSRGSPYKAAKPMSTSTSSSPGKPSPAQSASSIGSATSAAKMNNHSGNGTDLARTCQSPVSVNMNNNSPSQSNSPHYSPSPHASTNMLINHDTGSRTSMQQSPSHVGGEQVVLINSGPGSGGSTPQSGQAYPHTSMSPASSPSPPHSSAHSSSHSSPHKSLQLNQTTDNQAQKGSNPRQSVGSTNGHFVVELEPGPAPHFSGETC